MSETRDYCSYYVAYANSLGIAPQQVWVHDGENNVNYMSWIQARWGEWRALRRLASSAPLSAAHRDDFEAWLAATFPAPSPLGVYACLTCYSAECAHVRAARLADDATGQAIARSAAQAGAA